MRTTDENSRFKLCWDVFIVLLIICSCLLIPFQLAFRHEVISLGSILVNCIDFILAMDIALNFFTSFRWHDEKITDARQTAQHYLKTFFFVDLLANFPSTPFSWKAASPM